VTARIPVADRTNIGFTYEPTAVAIKAASKRKILGVNVIVNKRSVFRGLALTGVASAMVACGGGGGGGGTSGGPAPANEYEIFLTADRIELPINLNPTSFPWEYGSPGKGTNAPFTTELYVRAKRKGTDDFIPPREDAFGCRVDGGLRVGSLYYLDGDEEHEVELKYNDEDGVEQTIDVPAAFRAISLDANAGGASFHFHAGDAAGDATVVCSVTDPQSGKEVSTSVKISVGQATGSASQVRVNSSAPQYLFVQNINGQTQLQLQAQILDDVGEFAPNPPAGVNNIYARIVPTDSLADDDAKLRGSGLADNTWVKARSINGQAQFSLISGTRTGTVLVELLADRFDNNVDNGIDQAVTNVIRVDVVDGSVLAAPVFFETTGVLQAGKQGDPYEPVVLDVAGGTPPYRWSIVQGSLPPGLNLQPFGVIAGTPLASGSYSVLIRATDSVGQSAEAPFAVQIEAADPVPVPELTIADGALPDGTIGAAYAGFVFAASGGSEGVATAWSATGLPPGLTLSSAGALTGTPTNAGTYALNVTARRGESVANRAFIVRVN
jgi:hypothetical protein